MDDIEGEEDLQELEARLYGQIHHESGQEEYETHEPNMEPVRLVTSKSVINNKSTGNVQRGRYWTNSQLPVASKHRNIVREKTVDAETKPKVGKVELAEAVPPADPQVPEPLSPKESSAPSTGVILTASGGDPEIKRSLNPFSVKTNRKKNTPAVAKEQESQAVDGSGSLFKRKLNKLNQNKKIQQKKTKAKQARQKQKQAVAEIIVLDSSEDEDVVMIPVSPPPMVTIESSDEDEKIGLDSFAKPNDVKKVQAKTGNSSRCNSPSSVMSDDFIGQQDKSRLLKEVSAAADDEDMHCISGADDSPPQKSVTVANTVQATNFATPKKRVSKSSKQIQPTYEVTQSNFRAVDVYESESSDMPESVYAKGSVHSERKNKSSSSDVEEIVIVPKTKKLFRKRRASGSCRGSEPNDNSTDSEGLDTDQAVPFISRGEAVENCKQKLKKRQAPTRTDVNSSDNEFISKLADIVHGDKSKDESHESNHSGDETITARHIAEDVLNKGEKPPADVEREEAIPNQTMSELDNVLQMIDAMDTSYHEFKEGPRHGAATPEIIQENPENYIDLDVEADGASEPEVDVIESPLNDAGITTVFANREHVAWTEEMIRFYESSWGQEEFNVSRILRGMDRSANWRVRVDDRFPRPRRFSNQKCNNCCEFGHARARCPQPKKDLICYVCGDIGHREPRCPNTICLRCGVKTKVFKRTCENCFTGDRLICPVCKIRGHGIDLCPDKWRRYHSTTQINAHPNQKLFYNEKKACCICTRFGHLPERCRSSNKLMEYHTPVSEIRSHAKSYDDVPLKAPLGAGVVAVNIMCEPNDQIQFPFTEKVTKHECYGRFLSAVGLFNQKKSLPSRNTTQEASKKTKKNYVLNPFAKKIKKNVSNEVLRKEESAPDTITEDIQLNTFDSVESTIGPNLKEPNNLQESTTVNVPNEGITEPVVEKNNDCKIIFNKDNANEETAMDSDSNYSFSEHFIERNNESGPKKTKCREVGDLPDFIPLDGSDDDDDEINEDESTLDTLKGPISAKVQNFEGEEESSAEVCKGKIYLNKFHSKFLLSPKGSKFLIENSEKYNVKASIDWTQAGNVLIIEGYPNNQDKFHNELMATIKNLSNEVNRKELEQSQKVPRKRDALIKLMQQNILQLEDKLGNANDLQKRIKFNESHSTNRAHFRNAERLRRLLNMILMGQGGLREGRVHLNALLSHIKTLQDDISELVSNKVRDEIDGHWKYIFSSYQHENYDQLIRQYNELKKNDKLAKLNLNPKLLGKKILDTSFTKEQKEQMMKPPTTIPKSRKQDSMSSSVTSKGKMLINPLSLPHSDIQLEEQNRENQAEQEGTPDDFPQEPQYGLQLLEQQIRQEQNRPQYHRQQHPQNRPQQLQYRQHQSQNRQHHQQQQNRRQLRNSQARQQQQNRQQQQQNRQQQNRQQPNRQQPNREQNFDNAQQSPLAGRSFVSDQIREINKKWENQAENLMNQMTNSPNLSPKQAKSASCLWSRKSLKYIDRCMGLCNSNPTIVEKLNQLTGRASNNLLSFSDFKSLKKIYINLMKK